MEQTVRLRLLFCLVLLCLFSGSATGRTTAETVIPDGGSVIPDLVGDLAWRTTAADSLLAEQILASLKGSGITSVPRLMTIAGLALTGQPYVAGTLEETEQEELAIYLTRTDCILFVETCLALARTTAAYHAAALTADGDLAPVEKDATSAKNGAGSKSDRDNATAETSPSSSQDSQDQQPCGDNVAVRMMSDSSQGGKNQRPSGDFAALADELRQSRYRDGRVGCYGDRLHYTSEWILQGERRGTLREITAELGGLPYDHPVSYMSTHSEAYPRMDDPEAIRAAEARINAVQVYYIPKEKVASVLDSIQSGDILCFVSALEGLDILHVGLALRENNGHVRILHASSAAGKVLVDPKTLPQYLEGRRSIAGLRVLRPL